MKMKEVEEKIQNLISDKNMKMKEVEEKIQNLISDYNLNKKIKIDKVVIFLHKDEKELHTSYVPIEIKGK